MHRLKIISLIVGFMMLITVFSACGSSGNVPSETSGTSGQTQTTAAPTTGPAEPYPVVTDGSLTVKWWKPMVANTAKFFQNLGETKFSQELEKRTGIKIEWIHPPIGGDAEQQAFNIMLASRDLPDIIDYNITKNYPGGPEKALEEGAIISLNSYLENYAPDYNNILKNNDVLRKYLTTDSGNVWCFSNINSGEASEMGAGGGPMIRADLLAELGLKKPETISEWYDVLTKIKESGKVEYPFGWSEKAPKIKWSGSFTGAYGILLGLFQQNSNGKVNYGFYMPQYKDFLAEMNKWYREGLLDPEFASMDRATLKAKMVSGKLASCLEVLGSGLSTYNKDARDKDPNTKYSVEATQFPVLNKGDIPVSLGAWPWNINSTTVITTACKTPEIAVRLLNYGYTSEGHDLFTAGIEGETFTRTGKKYISAFLGEVDEYVYVDWLINVPADVKADRARENFSMMAQGLGGPYVSHLSLVPADINPIKEAGEARVIWGVGNADLRMPELPIPADKAGVYSTKYSEIDAYTDEMFVKFIMGVEPLEKFDQYIERLKQMGMDEVIAIQQETFDKFNKR